MGFIRGNAFVTCWVLRSDPTFKLPKGKRDSFGVVKTIAFAARSVDRLVSPSALPNLKALRNNAVTNGFAIILIVMRFRARQICRRLRQLLTVFKQSPQYSQNYEDAQWPQATVEISSVAFIF